MRKFFRHTPPFIAFLNKRIVTGRMLIFEYTAMGGLLKTNTDSG